MTTWVYYVEVEELGKLFRTLNGRSLLFWVTSFEDGIANIEVSCGTDIEDFAKVVEGCFDEYSNFEEQLKIAFECDENTKFEGIKFSFNSVKFNITKENADSKKIYEQYCDELEEQAARYLQEMEEHMKTPEYRAKRAKELKALTRKQCVQRKIIELDRSTQLEFKDERAKARWKRWCRMQSKQPYGRCIVEYARRWGKHMQSIINNEGKPIELIVNESRKVSDINGVTLYMYGCAAAMLAFCWKHGEVLRKYHNAQWGCPDADGVVNPALITISTD